MAPPKNTIGKKRPLEEQRDEARAPPEDPKTPVRNRNNQHTYQNRTPRQVEPINLGLNHAYGPDNRMEEDTAYDWTEEEHHLTRLYRTQELLNKILREFTAAQSEECLNFLTEDPEIKDGLTKLSTLSPPNVNTAQLTPVFTGITDLHKLMEQMSAKLDHLTTPQWSTSPDKSLNGSTHARPNYPTSMELDNNAQSPKPLYNAAAKHNLQKQQQEGKTEHKIPQNPKAAHHPSRLVIQFKPNGIPAEKRPDPSQIVGNINTALSLNPHAKHMKVVAANFNNQGNLILSTRTNQTADELLKFQNSFSNLLANMSNKQEIVIREDKRWYKIQIDGVATSSLSIGNGRVTHSADDVHTELMACNPLYAKSQDLIMAKPRWLRTEEELFSTYKSSLVFALTDESTACQILNQKSLAAFGSHCTLRAFQDRPPVTQCRNCWRLNHTSHQCKESQRCRLCGALHDEKEHTPMDPTECQKCTITNEYGDTMDTTAEGHCPHDLRCINCIANNNTDNNHPADARRCPLRLEKYGTARENERRSPKSTNPWTKPKPKKTKTKTTNDRPGISTNPPSQNRFDPLNVPNEPQANHQDNPTPEQTISNTAVQQ